MGSNDILATVNIRATIIRANVSVYLDDSDENAERNMPEQSLSIMPASLGCNQSFLPPSGPSHVPDMLPCLKASAALMKGIERSMQGHTSFPQGMCRSNERSWEDHAMTFTLNHLWISCHTIDVARCHALFTLPGHALSWHLLAMECQKKYARPFTVGHTQASLDAIDRQSAPL